MIIKILIILLGFLKYLISQQVFEIVQCKFNCQECDFTLRKCQRCEPNYIYNEDIQSCQSSCGYGRYFQKETKLCQSTCTYPYIQDEITLQCKQIEQCPYLEEIGQQYFDQFTVSLLVEDQIITAGRNSVQSNYQIKIFDSSNVQLIGQMDGHLFEVYAIKEYNSEDTNDQGIISLSSKEIFIWNLLYGQKYINITIESPYFISNKYSELIYIDSQFIILNYDDERQFGLFYFQDYLDSIKINQNVKASHFYYLFEKKHIKNIKGFLRFGDQLISYSEQNIFQWNISNQTGYKKCTFDEKIKGVSLIIDDIFLIYFFESTKIFLMTSQSSCVKVSEDDIQQEIGEIYVYSSSIFFILTNDELLVFQLNILQLQVQREEIPRVDLLQIQKIQQNLMMIRVSSEGFLVSLEPTGLIKIYQIQIDQESIESEKVLNYLNQYDFKFQAPMFLTNIIINVKKQIICLFGKQILSVKFDFYKNTQIKSQQTQKNIPKIQNGHTDKINGMLVDEQQKRIISYSDDGSFKVWELNEDSYNQTFAKQMSYESNFDNVNFIMEQYHPSCNPYNLLACKFKVLSMDIFKESGYLLSQYNDNTVVMWQYSMFHITYFRTFSLKDQTKKLNNFHIDKYYLYITISNNQEVRVFHLIDQTQTYSLPYDNPLKTYIMRNDFNFYLVILKQTSTIISALFYQINNKNLEKINFYIEFQGQMQSIHVTEQDENSSYANLYSFFISTNQNKLFFIDYNFNKFTTIVPVATALAFFTDLDVLICFSKSFQTYLVDVTSTNILSQFQYFNTIISENAITIPFRQHICFVYINNANEAIKNQVIGINNSGAIIYLATFEKKITSVKADHVTQKIFIGFQDGQIYYGSFSPQLKINSYKTPEIQDLRYTKIIRGFISFKSSVMIYDLFSKESSIFPKKHLNDLSGYVLDENNNSIITYSNEINTNLFKWDINALEYYQIKNPVQIKGGTSAGVDQVFLDLQNGFLITFNQAVLEMIVWTYPNLKFQFKGTVLQEAKQNLNSNNEQNDNGSQQPQYTYAVKQIYLLKSNQTLLILDNQDQIIAYNYQNNLSYIFTESSSDKFFYDEDLNYLFIKKGFGLLSVLKVYNISLIEIAEKRDHNLDIRNVIFKRKYTYSYDINLIAVIDKVSLQTVRTIKCLNPGILNIIISEKLDMIFIWNDYFKDKVFYQKIAIFNISSGLFYKEVSANQQLEYGNIGAVTLDESSYTLFFSRSNFCMFAFDLLRFVYTGYYIIKFNTAITQLTFLPEYNSLLCSDSGQIMFFNVENALNSRNLVTPLYQSRNDNYFIDNQQQKTYFIDYDNSLWILDNQTFELSFLKQLQTVVAVKFWNENIYLATITNLIKLDRQLNVLNQLEIQLRTIYFSQKSIFCQNQNYDLIKIDLDSLTQDSKFKLQKFYQILTQLIIIESNSEILILFQSVDNYVIIRYSYANYKVIQTFYDTSYQFMLYQPENRMLLVFKFDNNVMDIYSAIKKDVKASKDPNQDIETSFDFIQAYCAYKAIYDSLTNKLYTLSYNGLIIVYGFSFTKSGAINFVTIQNWLPLPTLLYDIKLIIKDNYFIIEMPWQLYYYDRQTNILLKSIRDNYILNNINKIKYVNELGDSNQSYFFVSSYNMLSLAYQNKQNVQIVKQFQLSYPIVINYQIKQMERNNYLIIQGLSNGLVYRYDFMVGNQSAVPNKYECQFDIGIYSRYYEQNNYLSNLQRSLKIADTQISQTYIIGQPRLSLYFDPIFTNLKSQYSAIGPTIDTNGKYVLEILDDIFSPESFSQITVQNYIFDISYSDNISFNNNTKKIILSQIDFKNDAQNFQMNFTQINTVILEDIQIKKINVKNQSSFFYFSQCKQVYIKNLKFQEIVIQNESKLIEVDRVQDIYIEQLIFDSIFADQTFLLQSLFLIQNSKKVYLNNIQISNIRSDEFIYFMQGFGIAELQIRNFTFKQSNKVSFLHVSNSYNENSKQFIQKDDYFQIQNAKIESVNNIQNSVISLTGNSFIISEIQIFNVSCSKCLGAAIQIYQTNQFILQDSIFQFNLAQKGGAIYIFSNYYNYTMIKNSIFLKNKAISSGGAIFLEYSNLQMQNTTIQENQALVGGGVRYLGIQPDFINQIINKDLVDKQIINSIIKNNATIHSNNFGSYSFSLKATSENFSKSAIQGQTIYTNEKDAIQVIDTVTVNNFQSGGNIDIKFQILDLEGLPIYFDQKLFDSEIYPEDVMEEIQNFKIITTISNDKIKVYGQYISDQQQFNQNDRTFSIKDMNIVSIPESQNFFYFEVPSISRAHDNNKQYYFKQERFGVKVNIQFRQCIAGEIFTQSGALFLCQECKEGFYSLSLPDQSSQQSQQQCERCPENAEKCYKNQIFVKNGYWRISNKTDVIIKCSNNQQNCNGDEQTGYCKEGHIGPLCEQCDSTGNMWGSRYMSDGKYNCVNCKGLQNDIKFLLPSILVGVFMVFYILFSVKIALNISQNIIFGYYLRKLNMLNISKSAYQDTTNMNMKAMMNYMQISQLINTFEVDLPGFLQMLPKYIGSPVNNFMYTLDCFLSTLQSETFFLIFLRTIWGLMIPVIYILLAGVVYFSLYQFKILSYNKSYLICGLVFIIFFLQPNIINNLLSVLSCRKIDQNFYILADVSHQCYTREHIKFILSICIPGLILWGFILPMSILKILFTHKNKLDYATIRLPYGFLYQDYKQQRFYWEFIKSYMKILMVVVLNFYGDPFNNKLVIIMIILLIYQVSLSIMKPYQMRYFQQLEKKSMVTLTVIAIMNIFLYNQPDKIQQQIFYLIVLSIHNIYLAYLIFEVLKAKLSIAQKKNLQLIKKKIIEYFPSLSKFIKFEKPKDLKTFHNWNKIRKEIIRVKMSSIKKDPSPKQDSFKSQQEIPPALISPLSQSINANIGSYNNISVKELIDSHKNLNGFSTTSKKQIEQPSTNSFQSINYFISQNVNTKRSQFFKDTHRTSRVEETNQFNEKSSKYLDINEIILENSHFIFPKSTKKNIDQQFEQENKLTYNLELSSKFNKNINFDFQTYNEKNESLIYKNLSKVYQSKKSSSLSSQKNSKKINNDEVEISNLVESQINQVSPRKKINEMIVKFHIDSHKFEDENSQQSSTNYNKEEKSDLNSENNTEISFQNKQKPHPSDQNVFYDKQSKIDTLTTNSKINQQKLSSDQEFGKAYQLDNKTKFKNQNIHSKEQKIEQSDIQNKFTNESSSFNNQQEIQEHQTEQSKSLSS
ncbi:hypothetical protein ABPG74_013291 [Tetrahymena malaccensis]